MATNWNNTQVLTQLNSGARWLSSTITYAFPTSAVGNISSNGETPGFVAVNAAQQVNFRLALQSWDDLIAPNFLQVTGSSSNLEFAYSSSMSGYAHAYFPTHGSVWFSTTTGQDAWNSTTSPVIGNHGYETILHEIGHALGLRHMGNYDGAGAHQPSSFQDSVVLSIMSYFGPTGPLRSSEVMGADWIDQNGVRHEAQTPMLNDVMAIQSIYGVSTTTRLGDTIYGFGSNITGSAANLYDFSRNLHPILTLFDSGGNDTLNLSGWNTASLVWLEPGTYSSANSMTNNIVIAYGTVIENAVGGGGADTLNGNAVANQLSGGDGADSLLGLGGNDFLTGGTGNDRIYGGDGSDTAMFSGSFASYTITFNSGLGAYSLSAAATGADLVYEVELFQFSDVLRSASQLTSVDATPPTLTGASPADNATGVSPAANLVLTFNETVQAGAGSFVIYNANGTAARTIAATDATQVSISGNTVTINPNADLAFGSGYYLNVATGVLRDVAGNAYAGLTGSAAYNFTTVAANVADDFTNDATTTGIVAINGAASRGTINAVDDVDLFRVVLTAGTSYVFNLTRSSGTSFDPYLEIFGSGMNRLGSDNDSGGSGNARITFTASASGTHYLGAGNAFGTGTSTGTYAVSANVSDTSAPTLVSFTPADNATGVARSTNLQLEFSEGVAAGTGNFILYNANGTVARTIAASDISQVTIAGRTVSIDPGADLAPGAGYYLNIAPGAIVDLAGNRYAGIAGSTAYNFSTLAATSGDDFPWDTTTRGLVTVNGAAAGGIIEVGGDLDLFQVVLTAGNTYVFDLTRAGSGLPDPFLQLYSPGVVLLVSDDDSGDGLNSRITYTASSSGTFYLGAYNATPSGTGAYALSARTLNDDFPWSTTTSGTVTVNGAAAGGVVEVGGDLDLFKVTLAAGNTYIFDLTSAGGGLPDPFLQLYSPGVVLLVSDDDSGEGLNSRITYTASTSGTFYLGAYNATTSGTGAYALSARTLSDDFPWSTTTSGIVTVNGAAAGGVVEVGGDLDLFRVTLIAGTAYVFDLTSAAGGLPDPYLQLWSPSVTLLVSDDDSGDGLNSRITYTAGISGTFYLGAYNANTSGTGAYTVAARTQGDDYPWSTETNGRVVINGATTAGAIEIAGDLDLLRVDLTAGTSYVFNLTSAAGGLPDPYLQLWSPAINLIAFDDDGGTGVNSRIVYTATASGTYYLGAMDFGNGSGLYAVSAGTTDATPPTLTSFAPADNATAVSAGTNLVLGFSETVQLGSGNFILYTANGVVARTIAATDSSQVTILGSTVTLNPATDLASGTGYYLLIDSGAVSDISGNAFRGVSDSTTYNFATAVTTFADDYPWDTGTSGVVIVNGPASQGTINVADDADLFRVTLTAGASYVFSLVRTNGGLTDPYLQLWSPEIDLVAYDDDSGGTGNSRITFRASTSGTYYLGVWDYDIGTGAYTLSAANTGTAGNDVLVGTGDVNELYGFAGNDTLDGGAGADTLVGGTGNDTYIVDDAGDVVIEKPGEGTDLVKASVSTVLGADVENLSLTATGDIDGTGNALANMITGNSGRNAILGGAGADRLFGGAGNDILDGGSGVDRMEGGAGDDTYFVDRAATTSVAADGSVVVVAGDVVFEGTSALDAGGIDTVRTTLRSYTLGVNVENLVYIGETGNFTGTGNALVNRITGGVGSDTLSGAAGDDVLVASAGNDTFTGGVGADTLDLSAMAFKFSEKGVPGGFSVGRPNASSIVITDLDTGQKFAVNGAWGAAAGDRGIESYVFSDQTVTLDQLIANTASAFIDTYTGTDADDVFDGLAGNDTISGSAGNDQLSGGAGNDVLDGGVGGDSLIGGTGNDTYVVDSAADMVTEFLNQGTDLVKTTLASYTLGENVEQLLYVGGGNIIGTGNGQANMLKGGAGNDTLNGGLGSDRMEGGAGNDTYFADLAGDVVFEGTLALDSGGIDTVNASVTYTLVVNVENLVLLNGTNVNGTGNAQANTITGNDGNNVLSGLGANDVLNGGLGNDALNGGVGDDTLNGGVGSDTLTGGLGADRFVFDHLGASDRITDFVGSNASLAAQASGVDRIQLNQGTFGDLLWQSGSLADGQFESVTNTSAASAGMHLVYNSRTGELFYDADGFGAGNDAVVIAILGTTIHPSLVAADFMQI